MIAVPSCTTAHDLGLAVALVFAALSILHLYWAFGGTAGLAGAIPERPSTHRDRANDRTLVKDFHPTTAMILLVAGALAAVSVLVSLRAGLFALATSHWSLRWSLASTAIILTARAIGDFNMVGFFKRFRSSRFAVLDTWLYSPFCGVLALGVAWLALSSPCRS